MKQASPQFGNTRSGSIFEHVRRQHSRSVLHFIARVSFGSSTLRMLNKGAGGQLRKYLIKRVSPSGLARVRSLRAFDDLFDRLIARFPKGIRRRNGAPPSFGHKAKIINLFLKALT